MREPLQTAEIPPGNSKNGVTDVPLPVGKIKGMVCITPCGVWQHRNRAVSGVAFPSNSRAIGKKTAL